MNNKTGGNGDAYINMPERKMRTLSCGCVEEFYDGESICLKLSGS